MSGTESGVTNSDPKAVHQLELRKLETIVKIRELEVELHKANVELFRLGARDALDIKPLLCW